MRGNSRVQVTPVKSVPMASTNRRSFTNTSPSPPNFVAFQPLSVWPSNNAVQSANGLGAAAGERCDVSTCAAASRTPGCCPTAALASDVPTNAQYNIGRPQTRPAKHVGPVRLVRLPPRIMGSILRPESSVVRSPLSTDHGPLTTCASRSFGSAQSDYRNHNDRSPRSQLRSSWLVSISRMQIAVLRDMLDEDCPLSLVPRALRSSPRAKGQRYGDLEEPSRA